MYVCVLCAFRVDVVTASQALSFIRFGCSLCLGCMCVLCAFRVDVVTAPQALSFIRFGHLPMWFVVDWRSVAFCSFFAKNFSF
jgi:hypothetical protein